MEQLPLHALHQKLGARFANADNMGLPQDYGNPLTEYHAVRNQAGLADLSHQGKLILTGSDRLPFLQKLISNDVEALSDASGIYATLLSAKGKVLSDFYLYALPDALFMEIESTNLEKTKSHLLRFRMRSRVELAAPPWGKLLLSGPGAHGILENLIGGQRPTMQEKAFFEKEIAGATLLCIKRSLTGETDYHLYYPVEKLAALWQRLFKAPGAKFLLPFGQTVLETLRVEAGKPRYGIDLDEEILPVEAGIQSEAISYTKGCYPGQEVIARLKTYGHANKHLVGLILEGERLPQKGDKVYLEDKAQGRITSAVSSPFLGKVIAMGYLRTKIAAAGTRVSIEIDRERAKAEVVALPFYKRETQNERLRSVDDVR